MSLSQNCSEGDKMRLINCVFKAIKRLATDITDEEFERARNCQATTTSFNLERAPDRIDEICKNLYVRI